MPEHISRKELKQDKIKETIEHGAEAVFSHGQLTAIVVTLVLLIALGYGGWRFYIDRQTVEASSALDTAMKAYQGRIGSAGQPQHALLSCPHALAGCGCTVPEPLPVTGHPAPSARKRHARSPPPPGR